MRKKNGIAVLFQDSSKLGLFSGLGRIYCVPALSRNGLGSPVDICLLSYKGAQYLPIVLPGGGGTMQLGAMLVIPA